jgi:hypothetical protein
MMGLFDAVSSFFSSSGQQTALARTVAVLNPFDQDSVSVANINGGYANVPGLKSAITTAEVVAGSALAVGSGAVAATGTALQSSFAAAGLGTKAAVVLGAPIAALTVLKNPAIIPQAAGNYAQFANDASTLAANPTTQNAITTFKNSPVISGLIGVGGLAALGIGASNAIGAYETRQNTKAMTEGNNLLKNGTGGTSTPTADNNLAKEQLKLQEKAQQQAFDLQKQQQDAQAKLASDTLKAQTDLANKQISMAAAVPSSPSTVSTAAAFPTKKATKKKKTAKKKKKKVVKKKKIKKKLAKKKKR